MASGNLQKPTKPIIVENVATFRRFQTPHETCILPEIFQKRKSTDVSFIIAFGACVVVLLALMIYALINSDMRRYTHGYDRCGNVCGSDNTAVEGISCSGEDMSNKPYLVAESTFPGTCVESCNNSDIIKHHRCYSSRYDPDFFRNTVEILEEEPVDLTILCFIGLGLSILALILFRYFTKVFVWAMLILYILLIVAVSCFLWYLYSTTDESSKSTLLIWAILFTIVTIIFALCVIALTSRIKLIIFFFHEAVRIVFAMPLILLEPVLTFISNFVVVALFVYTFLLMTTSGSLKEVGFGDRYEYVPNGAMSFALWWSVIMMLWMVQFTFACQQMVISGAIATYYFARDKLTVVSPIYNSFYNLVRYHLGTVAFGSLIITLITIIKMIVRGMSNDNSWCRLVYICCLRPIEDLLKYITSMGYIETAIHGQPLCRSSFRAINLIISNLLSAVVMNSIGNLVFFMAKMVVVVITVLIGVSMQSSVHIIVFGGLSALMCVHCFFVVFEIAVDTIFLCYCEDQCINNGTTNTYYTTVELYNQIQKAQAITLQLQQKKDKKKSRN